MEISPSGSEGDPPTAAAVAAADSPPQAAASAIDDQLLLLNAIGGAPLKLLRKKATKTGVKNRKNKNGLVMKYPRELRKKSLIRKRPVTFGNPALGTYHGCVYTLDAIGDDDYASRPMGDRAESVERIVAMVDVPPEEVPEGVLNLARAHRAFLYHVRIVIAENNEELIMDVASDEDTSPKGKDSDVVAVRRGDETAAFGNIGRSGTEETKEGITSSFQDNDSSSNASNQERFVSAAESAASILASDAERLSLNPTVNNGTPVDYTSEQLKGASHNNNNNNNNNNNKLDHEESQHSDSSRSYLVLLELCSVDAAEAFVQDLHGKPYTALDPTQKCSVHQVLAISGEDGVRLLSPFFAPSAKTTTKATIKSANGSHPAAHPANTAGPICTTKEPTAVTTILSNPKATNGPPTPIVEDYNCAVCLEHMHLRETDDDDADPSSILTTVCNHTFHLDCLLQWQDSPCPVCRYDHSGLNEALSQCHVCGRTENNYVCLICGVVSCGGPPLANNQSEVQHNGRIVGATSAASYNQQSPVCGMASAPTSGNANIPPPPPPMQLSQSHAWKHYNDTLHAYALDTESQHVWDWAGQGYVHRLLQNKEDGKLVEFHDPSNTSSHERSLNPGLSDAQEGEVVHRKLEGFASQYYTLLKSQLEQQRTYFQGRLQELRRESLMRKKAQTSDLIHALKQEKAQLAKRLVSLKARRAKVVADIGFLKNMNESLEANKEPLKCKIKEAQRQRSEARDRMLQCMPVLEEKVTQLMLQLTGEAACENCASNNDDEVDVTTSPANPNTLEHSDDGQCDDRKPAAKR
jgi:BRCA1-associated protein